MLSFLKADMKRQKSKHPLRDISFSLSLYFLYLSWCITCQAIELCALNGKRLFIKFKNDQRLSLNYMFDSPEEATFWKTDLDYVKKIF